MLLSAKTSDVSGEVSLFDALVSYGEERALATLPRPLHGFLVACLHEHMRDTGVTQQVLAITFLEAPKVRGAEGNVYLKRMGDGALLLTGFFPERALRLNVTPAYFRSMGQSAYATLSTRLFAMGKTESAKAYSQVAHSFDVLAKVLGAAQAAPETSWGAYRRFRVSLT